MSRNLIVAIWVLFFVGAIPLVAAPGGSRKIKLLRDGFVLSGVDGKLTWLDSNDASGDGFFSGSRSRWFFEFDSDISDDAGNFRAGSSVELLPSSTLQEIIVDAGKDSESHYRLWGVVTKFKDRNFIFPSYFLPLSNTEREQLSALKKTQQVNVEPNINEADDALTIPDEVLDRLKDRKIARTKRRESRMELKTDTVLTGRDALLLRRADGEFVFVLDSFGRNVQKTSFRLLPCGILERSLQKQSVEPESLRFRIAGILTQYEEDSYLLLQRAARIYSHQNFGY